MDKHCPPPATAVSTCGLCDICILSESKLSLLISLVCEDASVFGFHHCSDRYLRRGENNAVGAAGIIFQLSITSHFSELFIDRNPRRRRVVTVRQKSDLSDG